HLALLKKISEPLGIGFLGIGASPKWTLAETPRMPKSRYQIMTNYMPKVGYSGLDMMYRTATIQVNLDFSSETDMRRKMQVAMKLQSIATALFASSPFTEGCPNGFLSWRSHVWHDTDN
ncbi:MAG: glutamate-cysteine ligase family protein, partial [Bartonella sp.]|nr:glutamate-cysteine ligase family protein [Bartonella sp.]